VKIIIIIPTLNEERSIKPLINKLKIFLKKYTVLFVDDNSADNTKSQIKKFQKKYNNIKFLCRTKNPGIGSSIKDGIKFAIKNKFDICITMDADGTHDPKKINTMLKVLKNNNYDIISTNRFSSKNSIKKWPLHRIFLTKVRYYFVKFLLQTRLDSSGNFRCYNLKTIKYEHFFLSKNKSYFFLIESLFYLERLKYKISEITITLHPRTFDKSKMRLRHIFISLIDLLKLRFSNSNLIS
jgi:dolichol-phosphate mannosyltransferase